jgi:D-amino peptidase
MRVFMMTDLEGVAGVVTFDDHTYTTGKYYENSRSLLTGEINAAIDGLLAAGVDDVIVRDGHGSGGIVFEELHPAAKIMILRCRSILYQER